MIRTAPQDKILIEKAADQLGLTVSSFMLQNSIRAARKELSEVERTSLTERDAQTNRGYIWTTKILILGRLNWRSKSR